MRIRKGENVNKSSTFPGIERRKCDAFCLVLLRSVPIESSYEKAGRERLLCWLMRSSHDLTFPSFPSVLLQPGFFSFLLCIFPLLLTYFSLSTYLLLLFFVEDHQSVSFLGLSVENKLKTNFDETVLPAL